MGKPYRWLRRKFEEFLSPASDGSRGSLFFLFVAAACITAFVWGAAFFLIRVDNSLNSGTFGDFIGGILNPILTFITFMALLITIVLQQTELSDTRKELAASTKALEHQYVSMDRQNFETTFFRMLTLHNTIVNSIDLSWTVQGPNPFRPSPGTKHEVVGRDCFKNFYGSYRREYEDASEEADTILKHVYKPPMTDSGRADSRIWRITIATYTTF